MSINNGIQFSGISKVSSLKNNNVKNTHSIYFGMRDEKDEVNLSGKNSEVKGKYLKDEKVISQNGFTTTIEDKTAKKTLWDKITGKTPTKKIYDLPIRFQESLRAQNSERVVTNVPTEILNQTGLSQKEFEREIEKINTLINIVKPAYDLFEDKTQQSFQVKIGEQVAEVNRLTQGLSGVVYKIEIPGCKPLALKSYLNPLNINLSEGAFPEIALAQKLNKDGVPNIPKMYMANPYNGWMLSDFVDKNYTTSKTQENLSDYIAKNQLVFRDQNSGMFVDGKNARYLVDYGYISQKDSDNGYLIPYFKHSVLESKYKKCNDLNEYKSEHIGLEQLHAIRNFAEPQTVQYINEKYADTPEYNFYLSLSYARELVLNDKEIPQELAQELQKNYEQLGFIGDAIDLVKSCNQ